MSTNTNNTDIDRLAKRLARSGRYTETATLLNEINRDLCRIEEELESEMIVGQDVRFLEATHSRVRATRLRLLGRS